MNEVYLMFTDAENNHNKYYRMIDKNDGTFEVLYGRVGKKPAVSIYPISNWSKKYNEKIRKGYMDISSYKSVKNSFEFEGTGQDVLNLLLRFSKFHLSKSYSNLDSISPGQVSEAERIIQKLEAAAYACGLDQFNDSLIELFNKLPRDMDKVSNYLASSNSINELQKIVVREKTLLDNMKTYVHIYGAEKTATAEDLGIIISKPSDEEIDAVKRHCTYSLQPKIHKVWKVKNVKTQKAFDSYSKKHKIKEHKMFWHGSGNENWLSILENGLKIRPSGAAYTGSMFGDGLYFATDSGKSFNYTSYRGTYWRGGTQDVAFMAVFNTCYGKPYDVYAHSSALSSMNEAKLRKKHCNCLFAHKGTSLQRDEIVFYNPDAVTISYLVEFR